MPRRKKSGNLFNDPCIYQTGFPGVLSGTSSGGLGFILVSASTTSLINKHKDLV